MAPHSPLFWAKRGCLSPLLPQNDDGDVVYAPHFGRPRLNVELPSESVPGSVHDRRFFTQSGAAGKIPKGIVVGGDAGYQGIQDDLPEHSVITPFKKSKRHPLNDEQKLLNREFSRARIVVENTIGAFEHFKALAEVFRHAMALWDDVFRAVLAIVNPRIKKRINAASAA